MFGTKIDTGVTSIYLELILFWFWFFSSTVGCSWWCHQMETFCALLAICVGNSPVTGEFPSQRPVTRSFDFSLICVWINSWVNIREAGDLRRYHAHYDVTVMFWSSYRVIYATRRSLLEPLSWFILYQLIILGKGTDIMMTSSNGNISALWPFVSGFHRCPVESSHKDQWRGALVFSLICAWTNGCASNRDAGDLKRHHVHYGVTVMIYGWSLQLAIYVFMLRNMKHMVCKSHISQQGGCRWPSVYMAPGHLQPSYWHWPVL